MKGIPLFIYLAHKTMKQVIFYLRITPEKVRPLRKLLEEWEKTDFLSEGRWRTTMLEKICVGFHLIVSSCIEECNCLNIPSTIDAVKLISIWRYEPHYYKLPNGVLTAKGIPEYNGKDDNIKKALQALREILLDTTNKSNKQQNGKSENRLQEERASGAGLSEGRILYGGRDVPEYSAGRHCDQAGAQESSAGNSRPQVLLSSRHGRILEA